MDREVWNRGSWGLQCRGSAAEVQEFRILGREAEGLGGLRVGAWGEG